MFFYFFIDINYYYLPSHFRLLFIMSVLFNACIKIEKAERNNCLYIISVKHFVGNWFFNLFIKVFLHYLFLFGSFVLHMSGGWYGGRSDFLLVNRNVGILFSWWWRDEALEVISSPQISRSLKYPPISLCCLTLRYTSRANSLFFFT